MNRQQFVEMVQQFVGHACVPYRGPDQGRNLSGFDCSGFVYYVLGQVGYVYSIPRHSNQMFDELGIFIHSEAKQPGDLVFFGRENGMVPRHVGILVSTDRYIHSPGRSNKEVCIEEIEETIITPTGEDSQIYFHNPIGYKRITVPSGRYKVPFFD